MLLHNVWTTRHNAFYVRSSQNCSFGHTKARVWCQHLVISRRTRKYYHWYSTKSLQTASQRSLLHAENVLHCLFTLVQYTCNWTSHAELLWCFELHCVTRTGRYKCIAQLSTSACIYRLIHVTPSVLQVIRHCRVTSESSEIPFSWSLLRSCRYYFCLHSQELAVRVRVWRVLKKGADVKMRARWSWWFSWTKNEVYLLRVLIDRRFLSRRPLQLPELSASVRVLTTLI